MTGIEDRFTALYERHYRAIERYVRRRVSDAVVRDLAAEVFLVAWRRFDEVPDEPLPWLYGVARRVLANDARGTQRREQLVDRVASHADQVEADHADAVAGQLSLAAAFAGLSDDDREVLQLVAWEGLGTRDAAKALGCSATATAMRLHRARRRLLRELSAETLTPASPPPARGAAALEGRS